MTLAKRLDRSIAEQITKDIRILLFRMSFVISVFKMLVLGCIF